MEKQRCLQEDSRANATNAETIGTRLETAKGQEIRETTQVITGTTATTNVSMETATTVESLCIVTMTATRRETRRTRTTNK